MKLTLFAGMLLALGACSTPTAPARQEPPPDSGAQRVVEELYDLVCVAPGGPLQDWARVRERFLPVTRPQLRSQVLF